MALSADDLRELEAFGAEIVEAVADEPLNDEPGADTFGETYRVARQSDSSDDAYATVDDLDDWLGYTAPEGALAALKAAKRLFDNISQLQPIDRQKDTVLRDASCAQVEYWIEIGGGFIDRSQDVLRPRTPSRVGSMMVPNYQVLAPRAMQVFQTQGNWSPGGIVSGDYRNYDWQGGWRW